MFTYEQVANLADTSVDKLRNWRSRKVLPLGEADEKNRVIFSEEEALQIVLITRLFACGMEVEQAYTTAANQLPRLTRALTDRSAGGFLIVKMHPRIGLGDVVFHFERDGGRKIDPFERVDIGLAREFRCDTIVVIDISELASYVSRFLAQEESY
jgi:MerR HTH family regulatory protein